MEGNKKRRDAQVKAFIILAAALLITPVIILAVSHASRNYSAIDASSIRWQELISWNKKSVLEGLTIIEDTRITASIVTKNIPKSFSIAENDIFTMIDAERGGETLSITFIEEDGDSWLHENITLTKGRNTIKSTLQDYSFNPGDANQDLGNITAIAYLVNWPDLAITRAQDRVTVKKVEIARTEPAPAIFIPGFPFENLNPYRNHYPEEKSNGTFRILILGDSMVYGVSTCLNNTFNYEEGIIFTTLLERKLNEMHNTTRFQVLNFGIPGTGTETQVKLFEEKGARFSPDVVILFFYMNDFEDEVKGHEIMESLLKTEKYRQVYAAKGLTPDNIYYRILWYETNRRYSKMYGTTDRMNLSRISDPLERLWNLTEGGKASLALATFYATEQDQFNTLEGFAAQKGIPLLDLRYLPEKYGPKRVYACPNREFVDIHPSPYANKIIADDIYTFLEYNNLIPGDAAASGEDEIGKHTQTASPAKSNAEEGQI